MSYRSTLAARVALLTVLLTAWVLRPQFPVHAASSLTVTPITWNVVGLDSNNVNVGPNNFPVGVRACNPIASTTSVNNVSADFVWTTANANVNIRSGSLDPITTNVTLDPGECYDFYFEVTVTRTTAAWNTARGYRIDVSGTDSGTAALVTASSPTPREIYVEKLVSQNRNSVTNILLDGVSIPAGGTMNLNIGQTYTIQLAGATATNGYEQLESFINFPNTIFQINSVVSTYTANGGTDPNAATKLYADGCGWVNDPTDVTTPAYRECTGTGKYGGDITITYNVTIIATSASSGTINTLIYDFSGSSYHYNSDYSSSSRIYNIIDPNACTLVTIAAWNFENPNGTSTTASTDNAVGTPTITPVTLSVPTTAGGNGGGSAREHSAWNTTTTLNTAADYLQFAASTEGYYNIQFSYDLFRSNQGPSAIVAAYDTDGAGAPTTLTTDILAATTWTSYSKDLSAISAMDNISGARFLIYGYTAGNAAGTLRTDNFTISGCKLPAGLGLAKSGSPGNFIAAAQIITYTYTLTNTGSVSLQAPYTISDSKGAAMTISCAGAASPLVPGASTTCTGTYATTAADVTAGLVTNTATASAATVIGDAVTSNQATETVELAALTVAKQVSTSASGPWGESVTVNAGETVYFQITVDNTGNADLTGVTVDDGMAACTLADPTGDTDTDNILDAAETWVYACSITAVAGSNITNTATANSTETANTPVSDTAAYTGQQSDLTVTKTNNVSSSVPLSGSFTWTITANNGGAGSGVFPDGQTLLSDPLPAEATYGAPAAGNFTNITNSANISCTITAGTLACAASGAPVTIGAGGSFTVTFTVTPTSAGTLSNTVTIDPNNNVAEGNEANNTGSDTVSVIAPPSIAKSFDDATSPLNGATSLSFTISNPNAGSALTGVAFTDSLPAGLTVTDSSASQCGGTLTTTAATGVLSLSGGTIAAGGSCTFGVTVTGSTAGVKNNTTGNVTSTNGGTGNTASASTTVVAPPSISKNFSPDPIFLNGATTLTFTITNPNAGTALTGVAFTDPLPAGLQVAATPNASTSAGCGSPVFAPSATDTVLTFSGGTIPASGTCTVTVDVTATTGGLKNNTTGTVTSTNGGTGNTASDTLTVNTPSFSIGKVADVASVDTAGDVITYTVTLTNTGNIPLTGVSASDPLLANLDCDGVAGAPFTTTGLTIAVNGSLTCSGTYTVTQADLDTNGGGDGDIDNTVTGDTNETGSQTASAVVTVTQTPAHTTVKTETSTGPYAVGDTITYSIVVTNTGNVTLTGVTVTDNNATLGICTPVQPSTLAPTATMTCPASHVVTQADVDGGSYVNTATGDSDQTTPNTGTVTVNFTQTPALNIVKEVSTDNSTWNDISVTVAVGDTVYYRVRVANTGNVTLTGLTVNDNRCTLTRGTDITGDNDNNFEVGEEWAYTCSATAVLGTFNNTATADTSETPQDNDSASYTAAAALVADPALSKAGNPTQAAVGETVTFTITVTNAGNAPAPNVVITDPLPAMFDVTAVTVTGAPFGTSVSVAPPIGTGPAPYTVVVTLGGNLGVTDVVTIEIVTTVNSLGNPPINNAASLTTTAVGDVTANNSDTVSITLRSTGTTPNRPRLLPATGFAPNVETMLSPQPQSLAYAATDVVLEIPSLGVKIPIVGVPKRNGTWDVSWLGDQAGWLEGSAFPSWNGNSVLTSHVYLSNGLPGPFVHLGKLRFGDQIIVHAYGQKYIFEVQTNQVIGPTDVSALKHEEKSWLTLITCKEYDEKTNAYKKRVVVRAMLVKILWDK